MLFFVISGGQSDHLSAVQHVILVLSGKGGVGKSTVATQIALGLKHAGKKVSTAALQMSRIMRQPTMWLRTGLTQTELCRPRWLEAGNFGFRK